MNFITKNTLIKVSVLGLSIPALSGCVELMTPEELDKLHHRIHVKQSYTNLYNTGYTFYDTASVAPASFDTAPVGTVVSRTVSAPASTYTKSYNFNRGANGCGFDEHKHNSRPYCHGHQAGFVTTTLPSGYVVPKDQQASAHVHADGTVHY